MPEQEHQQRPDAAAVVDRAVAVGVEHAGDGGQVDQVVGLAVAHDAARPVVHLVAQPVPDGHGEAQLAPLQHVRGDDARERLAQGELRRVLAQLRRPRQAG